MTERTYMIDYRRKHMLTLPVMSRKCRVSVYTLRHLEEDDRYVTAPTMVERIAKAYELTEEQKIGMLPENYRPGPNYDPDKYVEEADRNWRSGFICNWWML